MISASSQFFIEKNEKYYVGEEVLRGVNNSGFNFAGSTSIRIPGQYITINTSSTSMPVNFTQLPSFEALGGITWQKYKIKTIEENQNSYIVSLVKSDSPYPWQTNVLIEKNIPDERLAVFRKIVNPNVIMKDIT